MRKKRSAKTGRFFVSIGRAGRGVRISVTTNPCNGRVATFEFSRVVHGTENDVKCFARRVSDD
jgi:hypothetical protein